MSLVETQKKIAKEVLEELEIIDPNCILAGGAPRDWFFNKPAADLDFYIYDAHGNLNQTQWQERLNRTLLDVTPLGMIEGKGADEISEEYSSMQDLKYVFEGEHYGVKIQVMVMNKSTYHSVVGKFCMDTSKVWWKGYNIVPTWQFLVAHATSTLRVCEDHAPKQRYIDKMQEKFPTYSVVSDTARYQHRVKLVQNYYQVENETRMVSKWLDSFERKDVSLPFWFGGY